VVHAEVQLSMDCRIKSGNDEHKIVLAAHLRPSCAHHHASKDSPSREKKPREAERRKAHPTNVRAAPSDVAT
jgi:hypothetical protein